MNYYIEELLDYLDLYKIIIDKNLYDSDRKKDVEEINNLISKLYNCYNSKTGMDSYDFNVLRRKMMSVFHPDLYKYKIPKELGFDSTDIAGRFNASIDSILECKKNGEVYNYDNDYEVSYSGEEVYKEDVDALRKEERARKVNEVKDKVKENTSRVLKYMKERIQASLFNVPANVDDYEHIKTTFEKDLRSLDYRKQKTMDALALLRDEKKVIATLWKGALDREKIETKYQKALLQQENVMVNAQFLYEGALKRLERYVETNYKTEYEDALSYWKNVSDEILADYLNEKTKYENRLNGYIDGDPRTTKEMKRDLKRVEREYKRYPNFEKFKTTMIAKLTKGDKDYKFLKDNAHKYQIAYEEEKREYDSYKENKQEKIRELNQEVNDEYSSRTFKVNAKIKHYERKLGRINNDIMKNIKATNLFTTRYRSEFEPNTREVATAGVQR